MSDEADTTQLRVRLPQALKRKIEDGARYNKWSINREFSHQLELSYSLAATVRQQEAELAQLRNYPQPAAVGAAPAAPGQNVAKYFEEPVIIEKLAEVSQDLRALRQSVNMSERTHIEVDELEDLLRRDTLRIEGRLRAADVAKDIDSRDDDAAWQPYKAIALESLPMVRELMRQIDSHTTAIVNLALKMAGKSAARIEGAIAKDHALLAEDRYEGAERMERGAA